MDYLVALQNIRENSPYIIELIFSIISELTIYVGPVIPVVIYLCIDKKAGVAIGFTALVGDVVNSLLKITACVYRPWVRDPRLHIPASMEGTASGYSFPSGHAAMATTAYGALALWQKKRKGLVIACICMILLTAFSRNFLGVHTIEDVLVAMAEGIILIVLVQIAVNWVSKDEKRDIYVLVIGLVLSIVALCYTAFKSYPMDYNELGELLVDPVKMSRDTFSSLGMTIAWLICWFVERRYIKFSIDGTKKEKIIRAVVAVVLFLLFYMLIFDKLFEPLDPRLEGFLKRFCTIFVVLGIYPFILKKLQNKKG